MLYRLAAVLLTRRSDWSMLTWAPVQSHSMQKVKAAR
jgi:hypothetical protein